MASIAAACRISARLASGRAATRGFSTSSRCLAAQNFIMPALSPTMTEGNIATWKVKDGDSFSAGDVLLEIETDKATMDVEAQEDGIMMKIISQDGAKAVQVGTRIAVLADAGDDIKSLELPPDEQPQQSTEKASSAQSTASPQEDSKPSATASQGKRTTSTGTYEHKYPLLPSVGQLIKQNDISKDDVSKIKGTGPNGRLLKGDVLAFLGTISADRPETLSAHLEKLSHLDLSNIKVAERKAPPAPKPEPVPQKVESKTVEVQVPVSLTSVLELQKRIEKKLGVQLDVFELIKRASGIANKGLRPSSRPPTANELFDQVLGLDKIKRASGTRGHYQPVVSVVFPALKRQAPKLDIIDILAGPKKAARQTPKDHNITGMYGDENIFSLVVPKEDKKRAEEFLEHCRFILEVEPQQLVEL
ncbi:Dihydrolipoamide dehydrogenase-binding protein of pyruvate dehydrogenase complex [Cladobotryum mycophilum]|uniref:Dihydrolipoamide dehydrogenase-binding protein of pyruvate dehydrogenase complex n=1 Tax=Cladobotryum mycophilum TaxID=491253 RepID=A0ABR0SCY6_9HYPO